jgi:hypothetical protein
MNRMRMVGLALAAIFALAALMAASASASTPTWKFCEKTSKNEEKKYTATYTDKLCSVEATPEQVEEGKANKYELAEGIGKGKGFKGKGGEAILHNVIPGKGDIKVECASFKDAGAVVAPSGVANVKSTFKKCKSLGAPCKTPGGKKEVITTNDLAGQLGYLTPAKDSAGEALFYEKGNEGGEEGPYLAEFECEGLAKVRVQGAVIGALAPFGEVEKASTATFSVGPYLGELAPGYVPLVNQPGFECTEEGCAEPIGVLLTELNGPETGNEWAPEGGLPSGQEGEAKNKGERLEVN